MPAFNAERFIDKAVCSILGQSYKNLELIVLNDGSTDSTEDILEAFARKDGRVRLISRENRGLVSSLNEGISKAKGSLIARMDADDLATSDRFLLQKRFLDANPHVSIVGGQAIVIDEQGKEKGELKKPIDFQNIQHYLNFGCPLIHPTYLARREMFDDLGGYREVKAAEDLDLLVRAYHSGFKFGNLDSSILHYRINTSGISASNACRQAISTRIILNSHRRKRKKTQELIEAPFEKKSSIASTNDAWFNTLWRLRNRCLSGTGGAKKLHWKILAASVSLLHPELFLATYRTWRCKKIVAKEGNA